MPLALPINAAPLREPTPAKRGKAVALDAQRMSHATSVAVERQPRLGAIMSSLSSSVSPSRFSRGLRVKRKTVASHWVAEREPNAKSRFWSKKNLNFVAKIKISGFSMLAISNF